MMTSGDEAEQTKSEQPDEDVKAQTGSAENSHAAVAEDQTDAVQAEAESASSDGEETSDSDSGSGTDSGAISRKTGHERFYRRA